MSAGEDGGARRCGPAARATGHSIVLRFFAILVVGLLVAAALTGALALWRAADEGAGTPQRDAWAARVAAFVRAVDDAPASARPSVLAVGEMAGVRVFAASGAEAPPTANAEAPRAADAETPDESDAALSQALTAALGRRAVVVEGRGPLACSGRPEWPERGDDGLHNGLAAMTAHGSGSWHCYLVQAGLADGSTLAFRVPANSAWNVRSIERANRGAGAWVLPATLMLALFALAAVLSRVAVAPLLTLSRAAETFAGDVEAPPLPEEGPREIRAAVAAFNRMQSRIRAHVGERTSMLAAIAHDLQTPLTRLRLRLEQVDDAALRSQLGHDLDECQFRVREGLDLARSLQDAGALVSVDLDALLRSACDEAADTGAAAVYEAGPRLTVRARPQALLRCVENLLGNAIKYGQSATVSAARDGDRAVILVRDRGPGIPDADLERVFEPFVRLEDSRSRATGGTGLGLYIVRNLMRQQHGEVTLRNVRGDGQHGLEARLTVPLA
ncbi:MAG TPA: ATP-binding protein [Burkholderiaceae bacterium]|nr:ATP-binding protein [Burkholderiaceae bacterium]